ncbi:hypothetical protein DITRI_Ditri11bG0063700 [Diplodiscus trichospermus]
MESGNRRLTLFEQMSAVDNSRNSLAGLTLDAVLGSAKRSEPPLSQNRTLMDAIRDDGSNKDKKSWKMFRDKLRLKRAGSAWTSSVPIPASDVNVHSNRSQFSRRSSVRSNKSAHVGDGGEHPDLSRSQLARKGSVRFGQNPTQTDHYDLSDISMPSEGPPSRSFAPQITRHHSTRFTASNTDENDVDSSDDDDDSPLPRDGSRQLGAAVAEERVLSAREAVAAQEASEAAAAAAAAEQAAAENNALPTAEEPVRMSLMDLLGETGSAYGMGDDDDDYDEEEEEEEEEEVVEASSGIEYTCCVCMVRHKGAAFIPCGHTFCRLCSRELMVQRGNCPLCNGFILEILDIF